MTIADNRRSVQERACRLGVRAGFLIAALIFAAPATRAAGPDRALLLHSFGFDYSPWSETAKSFRAELFKRAPRPIDLFEASVFTARFEKSFDESPLLAYLRSLFSQRRPDLIVALGGPAVGFAQHHRSLLFPSTPMLMTAIAQQRIDQSLLSANDTAVGLDLDLREYITNILRLRPMTKTIFVVIGNSPLEQYWLADMRSKYRAFTNRVNFIWSNDLPFAELLDKAAHLPPDSAVFYFLLTIDADGVPHVRSQALAALSAVANAPIFGFGDYELGRGIVGGPLNPTDTLGRRAAAVAVRILQGEPAGKIATAPTGFGAPVYDWRELQRWDIGEELLPPKSIVKFRGESPWREFRWQIGLAAAVIGAQTLLILFGLIQHRKRRTAERSLAESEERMTFTAASMNVGLWHYTRATDQFWVTERCRRIFELAPAVPFTRKTLLQRVHPDERRLAAAMLTEPSDGGSSALREFRIVLAGNRIRWIRARTHTSGDHQSVPDKVSGIFIDFTDLKAAESEAAVQRLELAHLMRVSVLGELSGAIAHELNQPLTAILANAQAALQLLSYQPPALEEVHDALADIVHEDNRAGEVIKRLRGLLEKGESRTEPIDVNELVEATMSLLHSELIARQIGVAMDLAPDLPVVMGDPIQLQQVLLNIVMNAMDAMAPIPANRRRIEIRTGFDHRGYLGVSIRDSGAGIKSGEKRLFEPFYTTKEHGLGLGLALCATIVEAHGGTLTLTNHDCGGAVAALSLPVQEYRVAAE